MEQIKNILYIIAVISITLGFFELFSSTVKKKNNLNYIVSLIIIILIVSPLKNIFTSPDLKDDLKLDVFEPNENEYYKSINPSFEKAILKILSDNFSIPESCLEIKIETTQNGDELLISKIDVCIINENYFRYAEKIKSFLQTNYGCEICVIQNFEENK